MSFVASKRHRKSEQCKNLETRLAHLKKHHISSSSPDLLKELTATRTALNTLLIQDSELSLKFARQKRYEFGDKPNKYLANLVKKREDSQTIVSITDSNGFRVFDTKTINEKFALFYSNLYTSEQPDKALALMHLLFFFFKFETPQSYRGSKTTVKHPDYERGGSACLEIHAIREGPRARWIWV